MRLAYLLLLARTAALAPPSEGLSRRALLSAAAAAITSCPAAFVHPAPAQAKESQPAIFGFTPDSFIAPPPSAAAPGVPPPVELDLDALPSFPNPFSAFGPKPPSAPARQQPAAPPPSLFGFTPDSFVAPPSAPGAPGMPPQQEMDLDALPDFPFGGFGGGGSKRAPPSPPPSAAPAPATSPSAPVTSTGECERFKTDAARAYCEKASAAPSASQSSAGSGASSKEKDNAIIEIYKSNNYFFEANRAQQDAIRNLFGFPPTRRPGEPPPPPPGPLFYSPFAEPPPPPAPPARPPEQGGSLYSQELLESMEESKQLREVYKEEGYFRAANRAQVDSIRNLFGFGPQAMPNGKAAPPPPPSIFGSPFGDRGETKIVWGWDLYKKITSGS